MSGATGNVYCGLHEPEDMALVLHLLRPGDVFFDVGANVGTYSLLAAAAGASEVHGFEPSTETGEKFLRNVRLNGLQDVINLHAVALGAQTGEARFTRGADARNHVVAIGESIDDDVAVPVQKLDHFYTGGRPSFIKLDVEGFEIAVLEGARVALGDPQLIGLLVEDDGYTKRYGEARRAAEFLAEFGFSAFVYDPFSRSLSPRSKDARGTNKLFLRDPAGALVRIGTAPQFRLVNTQI